MRVTIIPVSYSQDAEGRNVATQGTQYSKWAKVEQDSENRALAQGEITYSKTYTITMLFEASRALSDKSLLVYNGETMAVQSITRINEGMIYWEEIKAYTE